MNTLLQHIDAAVYSCVLGFDLVFKPQFLFKVAFGLREVVVQHLSERICLDRMRVHEQELLDRTLPPCKAEVGKAIGSLYKHLRVRFADNTGCEILTCCNLDNAGIGGIHCHQSPVDCPFSHSFDLLLNADTMILARCVGGNDDGIHRGGCLVSFSRVVIVAVNQGMGTEKAGRE